MQGLVKANPPPSSRGPLQSSNRGLLGIEWQCIISSSCAIWVSDDLTCWLCLKRALRQCGSCWASTWSFFVTNTFYFRSFTDVVTQSAAYIRRTNSPVYFLKTPSIPHYSNRVKHFKMFTIFHQIQLCNLPQPAKAFVVSQPVKPWNPRIASQVSLPNAYTVEEALMYLTRAWVPDFTITWDAILSYMQTMWEIHRGHQ